VLTARWVPYRVPLRAPFATAAGELAERRGFVVRVEDEDGTIGHGECAPLPAHGGESLAQASRALESLGCWLATSEIEISAPASLFDLSAELASVEPAAPAARAGIVLATADLAARREGLPLARWLALGARDSVEVNALIGAVEPEAARVAVTSLVAEGFTTLKIKLDADVGASVARLAAAREAAERARRGSGRPIRLRADANGAWDVRTALRALKEMSGLGLEYVEQPVPADDVEGLAEVRRESPVRLAADEALLRPGGIQRVLELEAADLVVLKPSLLGGLADAWAAADQARSAGVDVVVTSALDCAIGRAGALHLAAALPGMDAACGLATGHLLAADLTADGSDPTAPTGDSVRVTAAPGLGLALAEPAA
jgi:o-succinylbenzoate synthase